MGPRRYRQLFLFLAVLILPGVMIAVQGWRLSVQEQELAKAPLEEIRKRTAAERSCLPIAFKDRRPIEYLALIRMAYRMPPCREPLLSLQSGA